ncbi:MAG TPA: hypothetical protein VG186_03360 [Solirubrobacteraceae bacterium]|jgi:hypothetical protein|nr:hypothetical protein [Solirubrobacteraceae bacterium]
MATSRIAFPERAPVLAAMMLLPAVVIALLAAAPSQARVAPSGTRPGGMRALVTFAWLRPAPGPASWRHTSTATTKATLFYPPGWKAIPGDPGTVTVSLRDAHGLYAGYLNVTPRQGAERLHGWAGFRTNRNREEGERQVREVAAAEGLRFRNAHGSCVIDDYLSKVGSHPYREIACILSGSGHTNVFIGAALRSDWTALGGTLERAASALLQR